MRWTDRLTLRLRSLFRRARVERELDTELQFHLDQEVDANLASGMSVEDARASAWRSLGSPMQVKEQCRDSLGLRLLDEVRQDVHTAGRSLVKNPTFALIAVLTLALGIGASTAIFTVVNAVLLRPLPYKHSDRLVRIVEHVPATESRSGLPARVVVIDLLQMPALRSRAVTLSHVVTYVSATMTLSGHDQAIRLEGTRLSVAAFSMVDAQPLLGRTFEPREETSGADAVVILGYAAWQRHFGGDPNIVGRVVALDGRGRSVVGVMPQAFAFPTPQTQFWVPFVVPTAGLPGSVSLGPMIARVRDGVTMQTAAAEVSTILHQPGEPEPQTYGSASRPPRFELVRVQDELVAPVRPALLVLAAAVGFVLLIACVNVVSLLLARTAARQREIAVRLALGAGRGRLVRQVLTESIMLALVGGVAGTGLACGGIRLLRTMGASLSRTDLGPGVSIPRLDEIGIDASVLAFTVAVSVVTGVLFGWAPAMSQSRPPIDGLREGAGSPSAGFNLFRRHRMQGLLVVAEIAMAIMLFVGGGLLIHSFVKLSSVHPGYDPSHILTFQVYLPRDRYSGAQLRTFGEDLVGRLQSVPGVRSAAYAQALPMVQGRRGVIVRKTPDLSKFVPSPEALGALPNARLVSLDYLTVMGIRVLSGRGFIETDRPGRPLVMLINRALARRDFPGEDPVGQTVYAVGRDPWQIVGIVDDVRQFGLDKEPEPQIFADFRQWPVGLVPPALDVPTYYAVRTDAEPLSVLSSVRSVVYQLDAQATLDNVATMEELVSSSISRPRLYAVLLGIFAGVAVALAAIGIYGVMAYSVTRRTREIGIRMALGAARVDVIGLVLGQSLVLTVVGIVLGLAGAAAVTRYLQGMLFGVTPLDPTTFIAVLLIFGLVATLAAYVPARRATKVDPLVALRCE